MKFAILLPLLFAVPSAFAKARVCEVYERPGTFAVVDAEAAALNFVGPAGEQDFVLTADAAIYFGEPRITFDRKRDCRTSGYEQDSGAITVLIECRSQTHQGAFELEMSPDREAGFLMTFVTDLRNDEPGFQNHLNFENCRE